ncbi:predicted protein [Sclerotinia sclerotiorum 1980 UF-70]|uniref:Uncharacterized protein n=1 Tax=Sclerotinia sclerotiorum (strain ATCC 18683 / 1980 / Ss-1) TaxID=665079 RepID=A7EZH0_SCLS1|nr:predicted protein [Sclerotinia sclerotiorum 1980 UF-70]EDN94862.1 predicted protein [Sclerotinia sclerotiorum 1980 UF-70]
MVLKPVLAEVISKNLVLDPKTLGIGQGKFKNYFVCAEAKYAEHPRDMQEGEW